MRKSNKAFQLTIVLMAIIFLMSACTKDPKDEILNTLEGKWEVESYLAGYSSSYYFDTETWVDLIPLFYESFTIEFEEYKNGEGDFEWRIIGNDTYGYNETLTGEYECNRAGDELELTFSDSYQMEMEVFLNGDNLTLCTKSDSALNNGEAYIIEAQRK